MTCLHKPSKFPFWKFHSQVNHMTCLSNFSLFGNPITPVPTQLGIAGEPGVLALVPLQRAAWVSPVIFPTVVAPEGKSHQSHQTLVYQGPRRWATAQGDGLDVWPGGYNYNCSLGTSQQIQLKINHEQL
jgi:hypothetical protein